MLREVGVVIYYSMHNSNFKYCEDVSILFYSFKKIVEDTGTAPVSLINNQLFLFTSLG